jgi:hypothetical protein
MAEGPTDLLGKDQGRGLRGREVGAQASIGGRVCPGSKGSDLLPPGHPGSVNVAEPIVRPMDSFKDKCPKRPGREGQDQPHHCRAHRQDQQEPDRRDDIKS